MGTLETKVPEKIFFVTARFPRLVRPAVPGGGRHRTRDGGANKKYAKISFVVKPILAYSNIIASLRGFGNTSPVHVALMFHKQNYTLWYTIRGYLHGYWSCSRLCGLHMDNHAD